MDAFLRRMNSTII
jgi:hypothetical protein